MSLNKLSCYYLNLSSKNGYVFKEVIIFNLIKYNYMLSKVSSEL